MEVPVTSDAVVIGAGAFGCSTAHQLAAAGLSTVLVDRFEPASQTSPRAAGNTKMIRPQEVLTRLAIDSVKRIESFIDDYRVGLVYHQTGSLHFARTEEQAGRGREELANGRRHGVPMVEVSEDELSTLAPFARSDGVEFMWLSEKDLYLTPSDLLSAYLEAARSSGCMTIGGCTVTDVDTKGDRVAGVETEFGRISTPIVVDAAGAWSHLLARRAGITVPIVPMRHQVMISTPTDEISESHPICRVVDASVYMRPCEGGLMFGGFESDPQIHDMDQKPTDFQIAELEKDHGVLDPLSEEVSSQFPLLTRLRIKETRGGFQRSLRTTFRSSGPSMV